MISSIGSPANSKFDATKNWLFFVKTGLKLSRLAQ
jgi:hypothetical protein